MPLPIEATGYSNALEKMSVPELQTELSSSWTSLPHGYSTLDASWIITGVPYNYHRKFQVYANAKVDAMLDTEHRYPNEAETQAIRDEFDAQNTVYDTDIIMGTLRYQLERYEPDVFRANPFPEEGSHGHIAIEVLMNKFGLVLKELRRRHPDQDLRTFFPEEIKKHRG